MYTLFLVLLTAAVVLSPLALELWLNVQEGRAHRRRLRAAAPVNAAGKRSFIITSRA